MSSVYNADNELVGETYSQNGTGYGMTFQQTYDWEGRVLEQTRNAIGSSLTVTSVYAYNAENSVTSLDESTTASTIADYVLSYDQDQELTQQIDHGNTTSFAYDALGELTNYGTTVQSYTTAGNRTVDTTTYGNEVTYDGTYSYTYDGEGNEITKDGAGQTWSFTYDDDNHMIQASEVTAGSTTISDFRYDALGNMTEEDVTVSSGGSPTVTGTKYVIDAWNPAKSGAIGLSGTDVIADLRASDGSLITHYVWDDQVGGLVGRYDTSIAKDSGGLYFTMTDQQGSVRDIVDSSGGVVDTLNYDAFGNQLSTISNYDGRYTWESYDHDAATQLYFAGARVYDPESGRWMSQDPMGFAAGDSNLYRYVNNAPTNGTDPSGLILLGIDGTGSKQFLNGVYEKRKSANKSREGQMTSPFDYDYIQVKEGAAKTKEDLYQSHVKNFVNDSKEAMDNKDYLPGPASDSVGVQEEVFRICKEGLEFLTKRWNASTDKTIDLVGHSRGGMIAIEIARWLEVYGLKNDKTGKFEKNIPVRFLGLYDPVDMTSVDLWGNLVANLFGSGLLPDGIRGGAWSEKISSNVSVAYVVYGGSNDSHDRSRPLFNRVDGGADDPKKTKLEKSTIVATHSALGGAPGAGDTPRGFSQENDNSGAERADRFIRSGASYAKVQLGHPHGYDSYGYYVRAPNKFDQPGPAIGPK
jgi:RHS repeat-associated protein